MQQPSLYGLNKSNRDFSLKDTWGKNQFNSSFPASLCCYMANKNISANYLAVKNGVFTHQEIFIKDIFGIEPNNPNIYFAFETAHSPFQKYVIGSLPRTDLVIQDTQNQKCLSALEIKLTALPDNTTCHLDDKSYGSEIVVRPDSIVYLACSIADSVNNLKELMTLDNQSNQLDWSDPKQVIPLFPIIEQSLNNICNVSKKQQPFLLQPIWKTEGKSPRLAEYCLDVFCWSDIAFVKFILSIARLNLDCLAITRQTRTAIWLYKMLADIVSNGKFNHKKIIDICSYNTKNDKAFASSGLITNPFMRNSRLEKPIIKKDEIRHIILGGGQELLSPERRFDAIIYNSPELFL